MFNEHKIFFRYPGFEEYVNENFLPDDIKLPDGAKNISDSFFRQKLTQYLFSPQGARFKNWFQFEDQQQPVCGQASPEIEVKFSPEPSTDFYIFLVSRFVVAILYSVRVIHFVKEHIVENSKLSLSQNYFYFYLWWIKYS